MTDPDNSEDEDLNFMDILEDDEEDEYAACKGVNLAQAYKKPTSTSIVNRDKTGDYDPVKGYYDSIEKYTEPNMGGWHDLIELKGALKPRLIKENFESGKPLQH